jgi:hypothetical protein
LNYKYGIKARLRPFVEQGHGYRGAWLFSRETSSFALLPFIAYAELMLSGCVFSEAAAISKPMHEYKYILLIYLHFNSFYLYHSMQKYNGISMGPSKKKSTYKTI